MKEKFNFRLELFSTMWDKPPHAKINLNGVTFFDQDVNATQDQPEVIKFQYTFNHGDHYDLCIEMSGKDNSQVVVDEQGNTIKDQLLHIKTIEIDDINIKDLLNEGVYTSKEHGSLTHVNSMGFNGKWVLSFKSPFYIWMLDILHTKKYPCM